jgi:hypothetical protein
MLQLLGYVSVTVLWIIGETVTILKKNPVIIIAVTVLHACEAALVGIKTGLRYGEKFLYSLVMCLMFGFIWWLPLARQIKRETFSDSDFIRKPTDDPVKRGVR